MKYLNRPIDTLIILLSILGSTVWVDIRFNKIKEDFEYIKKEQQKIWIQILST